MSKLAGLATDPPGLTKQGNRSQRFFVFIAALSSAMLLWISFPPMGVWWMAWIAPVPLIWLIIGKELPSAKPYFQLWLAGLLYWLATFYFIPIPHPALWVGWIVVCVYMSIYTPLFVAVSRTLVHRFHVPVILAAPLAWTGIEWIRCNFATGMAMACLSHTQYQQPMLIQVADLSGAYTLTFAMAMAAAGLSLASLPRILSQQSSLRLGSRIGGAFISALVVTGVVGYGQLRLSETPAVTSKKIQVAIVQSSIDVVFEPPSEDEMTQRFAQYRDLTLKAREQWPELDLILWPESSFPTPDLVTNLDAKRNVAYFAAAISDIWQVVTGYPISNPSPVPILAGSTTHDPANDAMFNSAILISDPGIVVSRYYKNHRVMFGEYVPFADWFPVLQEITPIGRGLTAGTTFESIDIEGVKLTPSICFETTIPHLIRRQVNQLTENGQEPDVIVNLTNDGWFFGTSCLDLHLACNVFRSVEMRKPNLVCANTGFSAEIDVFGRLLQTGPRRDVGLLKAEVSAANHNNPKRTSLYRRIGDTIPMSFGLVCIVTFIYNRLRSS